MDADPLRLSKDRRFYFSQTLGRAVCDINCESCELGILGWQQEHLRWDWSLTHHFTGQAR